jgi:hypothetical protein
MRALRASLSTIHCRPTILAGAQRRLRTVTNLQWIVNLSADSDGSQPTRAENRSERSAELRRD